MMRPFQPLALLCIALPGTVTGPVCHAYKQEKPSPPVSPKPHPDVQALLNKGNAFALQFKWTEALHMYEEAVTKARILQDKAGEAKSLNNIGSVYFNIGQLQKALEVYQQTLSISRAVGDKAGEAGTLTNIGVIYDKTGQPQKALEFSQQALLIYRTVDDKAGEAKSLTSIGGVYYTIGQPQKALEQFQQALPIRRAVGDKVGEAGTLINIGLIYEETGQSQKALEFYQQALPIHRAAGNKRGEANTLTNIGNVYTDAGQPRKALEFQQQALLIKKAVGDKAGEAITLGNIGNIYYTIGQPQKALEQFQQALPISRAVGDKAGEAKALANIGLIYAETGQPQKALEFYQQALPISRAVGDKAGEADTLTNIGIVYMDAGQARKALEKCQQAIALHETYRENIGSDTESKQAYFQTTLGLYQRTLALLLQQQPAQAFALAQKMKARALLDEVRSSKLDLDRDLSEEEHVKLAALRDDLSHLNKEQIAEGLRSPDKQSARFKQLGQQLNQVQDVLADLRADLYRKRPQLARQQATTTLDLAGTAKLLTPDTALLEYVVQKIDLGKGKKIDQTLLFVVTLQNGKPALDVFPIALSRKALAEKTDDLRAACGDKSLRAWEGKAQELYNLLIAPAQAKLTGKKRLLLCPDGPLWQLPFAALLDKSGKTLWERYELTLAYSATGAWAAQEQQRDPKRVRPTKSLLVLANPDFGDLVRSNPATDGRPFDMPSRDLFVGERGGLSPLPGTQAEADALKKDFPDATILTGKEAQEATVKKEAGAYRYLHFATHGLFNAAAPMLSSVALAAPEKGSAEDGFLTAGEVYDMKLSADLVVLSACNTGRGEQRSGEGIVGLTWALQAAGCPSCVVSQWTVDDAATATLMGDFYTNLKAGKSKALALRTAALKLRQDGTHSHPYFWTPFFLIGDGK